MSRVSHRLLVLAAVSTLAIAGCASHPRKGAAAAGGEPSSGQAGASDQSAQPLPAAADKGAEQGSSGSDKAAAAAPAAGASKSAATPAAPPPPATPQVSADDLAGLEDKMSHYPRVLWHTHDNTYQFYVGTVLFAKYDPFTGAFSVSTDNAGQKNMVCSYQPDSGWKADGQEKGTTCQGLLKKLDGYLSD